MYNKGRINIFEFEFEFQLTLLVYFTYYMHFRDHFFFCFLNIVFFLFKYKNT